MLTQMLIQVGTWRHQNGCPREFDIKCCIGMLGLLVYICGGCIEQVARHCSKSHLIDVELHLKKNLLFC
jgi:hypothetical protein